MSAVKVSDLKVGQELELDIKLNSGAVLFKAAEKISFKHIKALKAWGFTEVAVVETQSDTRVENFQDSDLASDSTTEHIFSKSNHEDPAIIELKRISLSFRKTE